MRTLEQVRAHKHMNLSGSPLPQRWDNPRPRCDEGVLRSRNSARGEGTILGATSSPSRHQDARLADVLDVEREITRLVSEIEELKGERRFFDNRIALSTIELTLFEEGALAPGPSFTVGQALSQSLEVLSTSLAWLVYLTTLSFLGSRSQPLCGGLYAASVNALPNEHLLTAHAHGRDDAALARPLRASRIHDRLVVARLGRLPHARARL